MRTTLAPPRLGPPNYRGRVPMRPPAIGTQITLGVPFLDQIPPFAALWPNARLVVQMAFGATSSTDLNSYLGWVDVTRDVQYVDGDTNAISISPMGRSDAVTRTQPAGCSFQLDNRAGAYSQGPQSVNYPNIRLNIPTRVGITLSGASNTIVWRFWGAAWSMKPSFDKTGGYAIVTLIAAGKMRQMQQGNTPVKSALLGTLSGKALNDAGFGSLAYWSLEDGTNAIQAASPIAGVSPMVATRLTLLPGWDPNLIRSDVQFGAVDGPPGSNKLPNFTIGGQLTGKVPAGGSSYWRVQFMVKVNTLGSFDFVTPVRWFTADGVRYDLVAEPTGSGGLTFTTVGTTAFSSPTFAVDDGEWHEWRLEAEQSGGDVNITAKIDGVSRLTTTLVGRTLSPVDVVDVNFGASATSFVGGIGHVAVWGTKFSDSVLDTVRPISGWNGENAIARLSRIGAENGIPIDIVGTSTTTMGVQGIDVPLNILRECEGADLGLLGDGRGAGLYYISRSARYNQPATMTLDISAIADELEPEGDDQRIRNQYTVTRKNGSSATFTQKPGPNGTDNIQTYASAPDGGDVNVTTDAPLYNMAAFLTSLGTVEGYRYPTLAIDWRRSEAVAQAANWLTMRPGGRLIIPNVNSYVSQLPNETIDLLGEGWGEQLSRLMWRTSPMNCSPARPWTVAVLGSGSPLILDLTKQTLAADLSPGDTTLSLATASGGILFTTTATYPADFPVALNVGGWRINCTAASGVSSPQPLTITAAPNTRIVPAGTAVTLWQPAVLAL